MKLNNKILEHYNETLKVLVESKKIIPKIERISKIIKEKNKIKKKIFVYGNGGSFADSSHFVGELIATYRKKKRRALPFCLLCSNTTSLTAWSNDFNFDDFLVREFSSLNSKGDVLFLLSTTLSLPMEYYSTFFIEEKHGFHDFLAGDAPRQNSIPRASKSTPTLKKNVIIFFELTTRIKVVSYSSQV